MGKFLMTLAAILFGFISVVFAQTASENAGQKIGFSESVEYKPREITTVAQRGKPKKEKKKKKDEQANIKSAASQTNSVDENKNENGVEVKDELITVPVSVFDRSGRFIQNLKQSDFEIYADGKQQEIAGFETKDEPVSVVLMIDVSPSTAYDIKDIQDCAIAMVENLKPQDKVLVIEFSEATHVLTELTDDRQKIYQAIRSVQFGEGTSLYGAVKSTFEKRINLIQGRKVVILLTDGVDTTSRSADYKTSLKAAERSDAAIFPVYFDTFDNNSKIHAIGGNTILGGILNQSSIRAIGSTPSSLEADYELGRHYLDDIAQLSGGRPLRIQKPKGKGKIIVENVGAEIRLQYLVSFRSSDAGKIGERRRLKVRVNRPDLFVQARGSYIVGTKIR